MEEINSTKKGNARWVRLVQLLSVISKVLRATHKLAHALERSHRPCIHGSPRPIQTMDRRSAKGRDDRSECREIVQSAAFLKFC
jgi:hypothetical protein